MDILKVILLVLGISLFFILLSTLFKWLLDLVEAVWMFLPPIVGIGSAVWLWIVDHDNIAIVVLVLGFVAQKYWPWRDKTEDTYTGDNYYDPMEGKTKIYDAKGNLSGYKDKE
jgi:hypothetical protein